MSIEITNVQRLRVYTEAAGAFATDHTGTLGDFLDVPFIEGSLSVTLDRDVLNPEFAQQHLDGFPTQVLGLKSGQISFGLNLAPTGTPAASGVTAVQGALGRILKACMGAETLGTGTTVNDLSPGDDTNTLTSAAGVVAGAAWGFARDNGVFQARPVKSVTSNDVTQRLNFGEAPDDGDAAVASATYSLTQDPDTSLQFIAEGYELQNRWLLRGCGLNSMSLDVPLGQLPRLTLTFDVSVWDYGDDAATDLTASALGQASYSNINVIHAVGEFLYQTYSTVTAPTPLDVSAVAYTPAIAFVPVPSPSADANGSYTTTRFRRNRVAPVISGSFTLPYQDHVYFDDRDAKTLKQLWYQLGVAAGGVVCIDVPTAQIVDVQKSDAGSIDSQTISWSAQLDQGTTGTTDLTDSAFRIHLL